MPSPQSGQPGNLVPPAAPTEASDADQAVAGNDDDPNANPQNGQAGKFDTTNLKPYKKDDSNGKKSWIEIVLVDEENNPVPGEQYAIILPDGETVASGTLDDKGFARVDGIDSGTCQITFPNLDQDAWDNA